MPRTNYTAKTIQALKQNGHDPWVVERFTASQGGLGHGRRVDLWNLFDLVSIKGSQLFAVQSTGPNGIKSHLDDIYSNQEDPMRRERLRAFLRGRDRVALFVAWRKVKIKRGGVAYRWEPRTWELKTREPIETDPAKFFPDGIRLSKEMKEKLSA